jgi:hypothetical protein
MSKVDCPNFGVVHPGMPICKLQTLGFCPPSIIAERAADPTATPLDKDADKDCFEGYETTTINRQGIFVPQVDQPVVK